MLRRIFRYATNLKFTPETTEIFDNDSAYPAFLRQPLHLLKAAPLKARVGNPIAHEKHSVPISAFFAVAEGERKLMRILL
ncbi:MAG: hypothetical protein NC242_07135 [Roseburia sp.]|nr:hypothetical protein [Roseburia sp.]